MSTDQATLEYFRRIEAQAAARGLRVISAANPDGRGWRFGYSPLRPKRAPAEPRPASRRGVQAERAGAPQGSLF